MVFIGKHGNLTLMKYCPATPCTCGQLHTMQACSVQSIWTLSFGLSTSVQRIRAVPLIISESAIAAYWHFSPISAYRLSANNFHADIANITNLKISAMINIGVSAYRQKTNIGTPLQKILMIFRGCRRKAR